MVERELRSKVAEQLGIDISLVDAVIDYHWKATRKATKGPYTTIEYPGLGYLYIRKRKIISDLKRYLYFNDQTPNEKYQRKIEKFLAKDISHPLWDEYRANGEITSYPKRKEEDMQ